LKQGVNVCQYSWLSVVIIESGEEGHVLWHMPLIKDTKEEDARGS
jgi:hypothetical protein